MGRALASTGLEGILRLEESDIQYHAVKKVADKVSPNYAAVTAVLTALVSYRLTMRGEEWWTCFSKEVTTSVSEGSLREAFHKVKQFIVNCRGSIIQRMQKLARIEKVQKQAYNTLRILYETPEKILNSGQWLTNGLANALRTKPWKKTIVFSAKMAYYAAKTLNSNMPAPRDVPIPVDLRISCITTTSGIAETSDYRIILSKPEKVIKAWEKVAEISKIPPLNIDSLLWIIGWAPRDLDLDNARKTVTKRLEPYLGKASINIANQLLHRPCQRNR